MKENKDKECETGSSKKQNLNVEAMKPHLTDDTSLILQDQCNAEKRTTGNSYFRYFLLAVKISNPPQQ